MTHDEDPRLRLMCAWAELFACGFTIHQVADGMLSIALDELRESRLELAALVAEETPPNPCVAD